MRRIAWLIIPVVIVALLAVAVFAARSPRASTAFTLSAGDCFDIPADAQVADLPTIACTQPHDAEVFVAGSLPDAPAPGDSSGSTAGPVPYPGAESIAQWVAVTCDAVTEEAFLAPGAPANLVVGYFFPDAAAWSLGERSVTCYVHTSDGSKLTGPLARSQVRASAGS